jgi:hypothetical protein
LKIVRVIARLNMGGPALHVAYLTEGLTKRGYETTLVAGSLARGEDSMAFVADAHGVEIVQIEELGREISPLRDLLATIRLARLIRKERPQILHTHTAKAGTVGRVAARRPYLPRPRPARLLRAAAHTLLPVARTLARRRHDRADRSQPAGP